MFSLFWPSPAQHTQRDHACMYRHFVLHDSGGHECRLHKDVENGGNIRYTEYGHFYHIKQPWETNKSKIPTLYIVLPNIVHNTFACPICQLTSMYVAAHHTQLPSLERKGQHSYTRCITHQEQTCQQKMPCIHHHHRNTTTAEFQTHPQVCEGGERERARPPHAPFARSLSLHRQSMERISREGGGEGGR